MVTREQSRSEASRFGRAAIAAFAAVLLLTLAAQTAAAQTYTILYTFQGGTDGGFPNAGVYRDASGNLYGITNTAGNRNDCNDYGCGTIYKLAPGGQLSVLHTFTGGADGWPNATWGSLIPDPAGNLYGVASIGGLHDNGTVFRITPSGGFTVLHTFPSSPNDGLGPQFTLLRDATTGIIYGTTFGGGPGGYDGYGTVFALSKAGVGSDVVLHAFSYSDGALPQGSVASDGAGNLYGTAGQGGSNDCGVVFKMRNTGAGFTVLHTFTCAPDGYLPGSVVLDAQGNIYGGTSEGGDAAACPAFGCGIIYKVTPGGQETILHTFHGPDGAVPNELMFGADGNLWGTTAGGGTHDQGTIFKMTTDGTFTNEYNFEGGLNGGVPYAGLIQDPEGNFYSTVGGGLLRCIQSGCGMIFEFTPQ
ncbi:MAG: choice-of-anchor tandem repeat GloVer-containing protein [Candidatus Korobacteraceae bacterium]